MSGPAGGKSSRLQKLLALIDGEWRSCHDKDGGLLKRPLAVLICVSCAAAGGSSLATRKAAAAQIAGIATAHPAQLPAVLAAVSRHLRHSEWDARAAAGHQAQAHANASRRAARPRRRRRRLVAAASCSGISSVRSIHLPVRYNRVGFIETVAGHRPPETLLTQPWRHWFLAETILIKPIEGKQTNMNADKTA